jgi:chemotaxis response regulator CheB
VTSQQPIAEVADRFPVVGVGASAGGLEALNDLFRNLPASPGMGFVVIQHLDPHHDSLLPEIIARETSLPVSVAVDGATVEKDHVYVIPPNMSLSIRQRRLHLSPRTEAAGAFMPIDFFFRSLASDLGSLAVGVVLSGSGSDGALGLEEIKAVNGLVFVQEERSARHDALPPSAIATGCADFVLPPAEIARELVRLDGHCFARTANPAAVERASINGDARDVPAKPCRILVVDDNVDAAETMAAILGMLGHESRVAHDGPAAIEAATADPPDVMLLDLGLPSMDGFEVARTLRRNPALQKTVIIALTGYGRDEDRQKTKEAGFNDHLIKPVDLSRLERTMNRLIKERS